MAYPSSIDAPTNPSGTSLLTSPDHAGLHTSTNTSVVAIETVLGTTAGTSVLKNMASGDFAARKNNETLGSPNINGGTITLGSDATGDLYYRGSGTALARLGIGSNNQVLTSNGTTPTWAASGAGFSPSFAFATTSGPTTTSASYVTMPEMLATVTPTSGTIVANGWAAVRNSGGGNGKYIALSLNGTVGVEAFVDSSSANETSMQAVGYMWTGLAASAQTISIQWKVGAGTSTASALSRGLTVWTK